MYSSAKRLCLSFIRSLLSNKKSQVLLLMISFYMLKEGMFYCCF
nr:MAG TPA: hypothetical protein [Caudoviricetes sp.]